MHSAADFFTDLLYFLLPLEVVRPRAKYVPATQPVDFALTPEAQPLLDIVRMEYEEASEGFRHVHETAWQAGSALFVASGAIAGLGGGSESDVILALAVVPFAIWFWAVFSPFEHTADSRAVRLAELEHWFSNIAPPPGTRPIKVDYYTSYVAGRGRRWSTKNALHIVNTLLVVCAVLLVCGVITVFP